MSFPPYDKYKKSGVAWLGDVPDYWEVRRLKFLSEIQTGDKDTVDAEEDAEYPFFVRSQTVERISTCTFNCEAILTAGDGVGVGKVFHYHNGPFDFHQRVYMMNNFHDVDGRFLFHFLKSNFYKVALEGGAKSTVDSIRRPMVTDFAVSFPPERNEQKTIASFLDAETSKIDGLLSEQRRLIELLKEKRQAVISHAVTKGLNPNAPMKPSGIQWLGDVPQHWEIKRLSRVGRLQNGLNIGGEAFGSGNPFVSYGDVYKNANVPEIPSGLVQSTQADQVKCSLEVGDVLFTRTSETVDDIGIASTCLCSIPRSTFAGFLIRLRPDAGILDPRYSTYLFRNQGVKGHFSGTMNMVTRASLSQDVLKMLPICVPPIKEQGEIAAYIEEKVELFRGLIAEAERAIELLQERRTALISAAVTGKIDVRNFRTTQFVNIETASSPGSIGNAVGGM